MKSDIHPAYYENLKITCACGNIIIAGSTRKDLRTELCSACHPFYTGKQKLVDTAGRVDKFLEKVKKMEDMKAKKAQKSRSVPIEEEVATPPLKEKPEKATVAARKSVKKAVKKSTATKKTAKKKTAKKLPKTKKAAAATKKTGAKTKKA